MPFPFWRSIVPPLSPSFPWLPFPILTIPIHSFYSPSITHFYRVFLTNEGSLWSGWEKMGLYLFATPLIVFFFYVRRSIFPDSTLPTLRLLLCSLLVLCITGHLSLVMISGTTSDHSLQLLDQESLIPAASKSESLRIQQKIIVRSGSSFTLATRK